MNTLTIEEIARYAKMFHGSGLFTDCSNLESVGVKIQAGQEKGMGPFEAMQSISIIQGKPTFNAGWIASRIKGSEKYNYQIEHWDNETCSLKFQYTQQGGWIDLSPLSEFSVKDADKAGLLGNPVWKKYPRNMLFARALTNGARLFCADVFGGAVYTAEELGSNKINEEDLKTIEPPPQPVDPDANHAIEEEELNNVSPEELKAALSLESYDTFRNWVSENKYRLTDEQMEKCTEYGTKLRDSKLKERDTIPF